MATKRQQLVTAITNIIKQIDGTEPYRSNLNGNVKPKLVFWDEVTDYPTVCVSNGIETRDYQTGGFSWGYLTISITIYVDHEDPKDQLERIFADIEDILEANNTLIIDGISLCTDMRLLSISDDNGVLAPLGIGEMEYQVQYST